MSSVEPKNDTHNDQRTSTILNLDHDTIKLLQSIAFHQMLVSFGYIRKNAFNICIPTSIVNYIAIFAFYDHYQYQSDFDKNGIVYGIATNYGQTQWENPAKQDLISIKSNDWHQTSNIEDVLTRTNVEGECSSSNIRYSWLTIDFGAKKKIKPSHYSLKHDCSTDYYLRNWYFQASNNGTNWKTLRQHMNDTNLNSSHATHTWAIYVDKYYQMFRILMSDKNTSGTWYLTCGGFEIYGHLSVIDANKVQTI